MDLGREHRSIDHRATVLFLALIPLCPTWTPVGGALSYFTVDHIQSIIVNAPRISLTTDLHVGHSLGEYPSLPLIIKIYIIMQPDTYCSCKLLSPTPVPKPLIPLIGSGFSQQRVDTIFSACSYIAVVVRYMVFETCSKSQDGIVKRFKGVPNSRPGVSCTPPVAPTHCEVEGIVASNRY